MNNAWNVAKEMADKHSGLFVRLQDDGDSMVGAFVGEPHAREVHWVGGRSEECAGGCPHCSAGAKKAFRVLFNFFVPNEGMKIFEGSTAFFGEVLAAREKYGLDGWLFEVKRHGAARDRRTKYTLTAAGPITPDVAARIAAAKRHELAREAKPIVAEPEQPARCDDDRDSFF